MNHAGYAGLVASIGLIIAYLIMFRSHGLSGGRTLQIALIWVAIIGGGYLLASWITGMR